MFRNLTITLLLVIGLVYTSAAQVDVANPGLGELQVDTTFYDVDSSSQIRRNGLFSIFKGKPGKAALFGLIVPAGGQAYNRRYWKIPLALGIDGWGVYNFVFNSQKFNEWNDALLAINNDEIQEYKGLSSASQIKNIRDGYRQRREYGILLMVGAHVLTIAEAFVDRHLMDFDISDDLTFGVEYGQSSKQLAVGVFYKL